MNPLSALLAIAAFFMAVAGAMDLAQHNYISALAWISLAALNVYLIKKN